jgi:hypothetical protein
VDRYTTQAEVDAARCAGPATICVKCGRPFVEHTFGRTWPGPAPGSFVWCDVPVLYVGDDEVFFPEHTTRVRPEDFDAEM